MEGLSVGEKHFINGGISQNLRSDGRKRNTYRPVFVETGVIPQANGSARVQIGATEVIASVKAELGKPSALQPNKEGKIAIFVDCSPVAEPTFKARGGEELSAELTTGLRCLLCGKSGAAAEGKFYWDLYIDCLVICSDGNLLDALGAAVKAALSNTGIPKVNVAAGTSGGDEQPDLDISDEEFLQFDDDTSSGIPVIVTLTKVGGDYIVDATSEEEESHVSSAVSISVNKKGHVCGLTKRGGAGMHPRVISKMISSMISKRDSEISDAEADEMKLDMT